MGQEDPSKPKGAPLGPRVLAAPIPRQFSDARRRAVPVLIAHSRGCPQKLLSPYIHRVQHTVLSVAGLKGSLNEYELDLLRQRSVEARREKAKRGELIVAAPAGYVKGEDRLEKDPDRRVQERVLLVFSKFFELGSARQTLLWFLEHGLQVPVSAPRDQVVWRRPRYTTIYSHVD